MAPGFASREELDARKIVGVNTETVTNVTSTDIPGHYPGEDHEWDLDEFRRTFKVEFHKLTPHDASFSLIGLDASIANAFRRILLAEIPTLAIEYVFVHNNTSIVQDEVLAHRLGLIPLTGNPAGLRWLQQYRKPTDEDPEGSGVADNNTIVMKLQVECTKADNYNELDKKGEDDPRLLYKNAHVYAKQLEYVVSGRQDQFFAGGEENAVRSVHPDILLAKMRPGQCIDMEMHCIKGIGADHAKFSPVATASYRLLPTITITQPILGNDAKKFARCFPKGVIALEDVTSAEADRAGSGYEGHEGEKKAVVQNTFKDTVSRECLRHEEFKGKVKLGRVRDHFIFGVESTGQFESDELFLESVKVLREKCRVMKMGLANVMR
ncbi:MAG: hypothetical protein LQ350_007113 [Teloschistes chrysophthalmus]|nr:MAG: hypothetical protein LQ350_007113 [Niorma chrysophthalma]